MQIQFAQNLSGTGQNTTGSFADFLTVPITTVGESAKVEISAICGFVKSATGNVNIQILWDGVAIGEAVVSANAGYYQPIVLRAVVTGVSPGAHTAKLQAKHNTSGALLGGTYTPSSLVVTEW